MTWPLPVVVRSALSGRADISAGSGLARLILDARSARVGDQHLVLWFAAAGSSTWDKLRCLGSVLTGQAVPFAAASCS